MLKINRLFILTVIMVFICHSLVAADNGTYIEVEISKHDTLRNICNVFLEDPDKCNEIVKINHLKNPDQLYSGQKLIIPAYLLKGTPVDGTITFIKGIVEVREKDSTQWRTPDINDVVRQGSSIKTGSNSTLVISFENGDSLFLRSDTTLDINFSVKTFSQNFIRKLLLKTGRVISKIKEITGKKSRNEIQTPSAVAAARGTEFRVSVDTKGTTRTEVLKGFIGVQAMQQEVAVQEGEGTLIRINEPPLQPRKLLSPPSPVSLEQLYRSMPITFQFGKIKDAVSYRVLMSRDLDFKDVVESRIIDPDQTFEIADVHDGKYFLQGRSIDRDGIEGIPSVPREIVVRVNPLPPFLELPVDKTELTDRSVQFKWLQVKDAVQYHLQISLDSEFKRVVSDTNDIKRPSYTAPYLDFSTYYYRVSAIAEDGYEGLWSDIYSFSILPRPYENVIVIGGMLLVFLLLAL